MSVTHPPNNQRLINLLDAWKENRSKETYSSVRTELLEGNSFLMLPSGDEPASAKWHITQKPTKLKLASLYTKDGIKTLGAFTDPDAVLIWSKGKPTNCVSLLSKAVLELCEREAIKQIIINSGSENVFPLTYYLNNQLEPGEVYW